MILTPKKALGNCKRGFQGLLHALKEPLPKYGENENRIIIGRSVQNRPIYCTHFGNGICHVLFASAIHGNEVGTIKLAHHLIQWLKNRSFQNLTISVIPCLNPDGYALAKCRPQFFQGGIMGRLNGNGVDLNRNFPTASFKQNASRNFGKEYLETAHVNAGKHGGSEPETKALTSYVLDNDISFVCMLHSRGNDVMSGYDDLSGAIAKLYADATVSRLLPSDHWRQLSQTGICAEWCNENQIATIEVETPYRWGSDWERQRKGIEVMLNYLEAQ